MFYLQILVFSPIIILIFLISPFLKIKIGKIRCNLIGHMTTPIEIFMSEKNFGLRPKNEVILWYRDKRSISNKFLYNKLKDNLVILPGFILYPLHILFSKFAYTEQFVYYKVVNNPINSSKKILYDKLYDNNNVLEKTPSNIKFTKKEIKIGNEFLKQNNINPEENLVCFGSRSKFYKKEEFTSIRNASIKSQMLGIKFLTDKNYQAIRMGRDEVVKINGVNNKIFDFSFSKFKDDFIDIYIISKSKFMISTEHGLNEVATSMRVPKLIVNFWGWHNLQSQNLTPIILPKKIFYTKENRLLSYSEIFDKKLSNISTIENLGTDYKIIDNNENEIAESIKEIFNYINKVNFDYEKYFQEQHNFWRVFHKFYNFTPHKTIISPSFFKKFKVLFA